MSQLRNPDDIPVVSDDAEVRVRFAPSPTGTPHVGLIRTALFNWGWARHTGGKMIFRVEDTDQKRDSEESYQQLLDAMEWMGIDWDEGVEVGGPHEPYRQSQRGESYQDVIAKLKDAGFIYPSYTTAEETEARHKAAGRDQKLGYDGYDRHLTEEQIAAFEAEGRKPVWRLRMPDHDLSFTDTVRGTITFSAGSVADFVVVRADGSPLYTLVNPVDDALMGITHVLRGEDLLSSTPRQVALYEALKAIGVADATPQFGHLPYVMRAGNSQLAKRDHEADLSLHREDGFTHEGLLNYLSLLGWAISPDEDIFTVDELTAAFDVADVNANPARFDIKKAEAINAVHVRRLEPEDFRNRLVPYLHAASILSAESWDGLDAREQKILDAGAPLVQERMNLLGESVGMLGFLFIDDADLVIEDAARSALKDTAPAVLDAAIEVLADLGEEEFLTDRLQEVLRAKIVDEMEIKPRFAFGPLRTAMSGRRVSPPLFESMEILGKDSSMARLRALRELIA